MYNLHTIILYLLVFVLYGIECASSVHSDHGSDDGIVENDSTSVDKDTVKNQGPFCVDTADICPDTESDSEETEKKPTFPRCFNPKQTDEQSFNDKQKAGKGILGTFFSAEPIDSNKQNESDKDKMKKTFDHFKFVNYLKLPDKIDQSSKELRKIFLIFFCSDAISDVLDGKLCGEENAQKFEKIRDTLYSQQKNEFHNACMSFFTNSQVYKGVFKNIFKINTNIFYVFFHSLSSFFEYARIPNIDDFDILKLSHPVKGSQGDSIMEIQNFSVFYCKLKWNTINITDEISDTLYSHFNDMDVPFKYDKKFPCRLIYACIDTKPKHDLKGVQYNVQPPIVSLIFEISDLDYILKALLIETDSKKHTFCAIINREGKWFVVEDDSIQRIDDMLAYLQNLEGKILFTVYEAIPHVDDDSAADNAD